MEPVAAGGRRGAGFLQEQFELDVRDCVGGHQQLEAVEAGDEFLCGVFRPEAGHLREARLVADEADDFGEERAGSAGGVEHLHAVDAGADFRRVREAVLEPELGAEDRVDAAHDELHDAGGRVPDAAALAQERVVVAQEVLVEVDHRVAGERLFAFPADEDPADVGGAEDGGEVVDEGADAVVEVGAGDVAEQRAEEGIGLRDEFRRLVAVEGVQSLVVEASGEHAVDHGLRVGVREEFGGEVVDEQLAEHLVLGAERGVGRREVVPVREVAREGVFDDVGDLPRLAGHHAREFAGPLDGLHGSGAPGCEGRGEKFECVVVGDDVVRHEGFAGLPLLPYLVRHPPEDDLRLELAVFVEAEAEEVGEHDLVEGGEVAVELLLVRGAAFEVVVERRLRLDVADGDVLFGQDDVRRPARDALGLVGGDEIRRQRADQFHDRRAVGVLRRHPGAVDPRDFCDVGGDCVTSPYAFRFHASLPI